VGNGDDADDVSVTPKDERIREPLQGYSPMDWIQFLAERRNLDENCTETLDLEKEIAAQSVELPFIVFGCFR
jgi:hypothetical protein